MTTTLITDPNTLQCWTSHRETDCRTALVRGLKEYLEQATFSDPALSQRLKLAKVLARWAEPEDTAKFPSAAVYTQEAGIYDDDDFTSEPIELEDDYVIRLCSELVQPVILDVYCTDDPQRMSFAMMLEDLFEPVDWMSGFRLMLPHYFGIHAEYLKLSIDYVDNEENAQKRWRLAQFQLEARVSQVRFIGKVPKFQPKAQVYVKS